MPSSNQPFFPVFLKLRGREALLVGGGRVAAAKLELLLLAGARVTVASGLPSPPRPPR